MPRRLIHHYLLACMLAFGTLTLVACSRAPDAGNSSRIPTADIPYQKFVLANGLTLIVHEDHKTPIVAVNVWYHVGSKDEKLGKTGFAHLFEHLMFQGSENHKDEYFRPFEDAGATDMNGTTAEDRTNYFANVPTPALDMALWMESDRMGHLLGAIDQAKLDEQRGVVQNEKRQRENAPYGKVWDMITTNTYPSGHPYSWPVIGSMQDLNAASLDDVRDWFRRYYGAANAVIVVAGDVKPAEAKAKVEKYFGDIPAGPPVPRQLRWVAKMQGEHRQTMQDRVPQARIYKVWNVPENNSPTATELQLAAQLLAGSKNSRLYQRLVYQDQIATEVSADIDAREIGSQFLISATARPGTDLKIVEKALDEELNRFLKSGPNREELERVRTSSFASFLRGTERIGGFGGKSEILASGEIYAGSPDAYKKDLEVLRKATTASIRKAARNWLSDGVYVLSVEPYPEFKTQAAAADRNSIPQPGTPPNLRLPDLQRTQLGNGLKVVLAERHDAPVVEMNLIVNAGYAADSLSKPGTARLALDMFTEGTGSRSSLEISSQLEALGASLGAGSSLDTSTVSLSAISALLDPALDIYADVIRNPSFPKKELDRVKKERLADIQQEKSRPATLAQRILPPLLYGTKHAYGMPLTGSGTEASVNSMTVEDMRSFQKTWVRPDNATLLVVGDVTLPQLKKLLDAHFGAWQSPAQALPAKNLAAVDYPPRPRVFLMDRPEAEQSLIIAGEIAPPFDADRNIAMGTLNAILGGMFTSRLNMNLREDKHWSYGARSVLTEAKGQQPFMAYAAVQSDKTAESMREMLGEITRMSGNTPATAVELLAAQNNLTRKLPGQHETDDAIAATLGDSIVFNLPDDYYQTYVTRVRGLQVTELQQAAALLLRPDALTWVVVGDLDKIEAPVRALNLGELHVLDTDGHVLR